ncbi:MAG: UvrD-helicase domain-containing protein [Thermodesulfobacteriota bacterium]
MTAANSLAIEDQDQRRIILEDLDSTILVEAAAGTGKTTSMVGRMVNLLAVGKCSVETLAAVTFTRKAAAELRSRFQVELEKAQQNRDALKRSRLAAALSGLESCFIGTIHSLCGRMLRERPVEAGVDMDFQEIDEEEDSALRERAWHSYVAGMYERRDPVLGELEALGVELGQLRNVFMELADFPDVEEWPAPALPCPEIGPAVAELEKYVSHMEKLAPSLPEDPGNCKLIPQYRRIPLLFRQAKKRNRVPDFMEVFAEFTEAKPVKKNWPGKALQANAESEKWEEFRTVYAEPLVQAWKEHRYEPLLRAVRPALDVYDALRAREGKLNYQDLLMKSAALLRDASHETVRRHFRRRFTHVLVDEFQDTDPVQAEVIMLLTAGDIKERDWRKCVPVPGSLFVVGDPKQSIYRFRRADIVTYNLVKRIIENNGGRVVHLTTNFRTTTDLAHWVNRTFEEQFGKFPPECSPEYVSLQAIREGGRGEDLSGLRSLPIPKEFSNKQMITEYESGVVASVIRKALDSGEPVLRTDSEKAAQIPPEARPGDFLVITRTKQNLSTYSRKLQELGVPHQVTGGKALNQIRELRLLETCLSAVLRPEDPVALVAVLRGNLFGISDNDLFAYKEAGGSFSFYSAIPAELPPAVAELYRDAFDRLKQYELWLKRLPAVSAIERIAGDLGLPALASAGRGGDILAGSFAKAIELIRGIEAETWSLLDLVKYMKRLVNEDEAHDSISARAHGEAVVRLMNLHKVKGLEAPVVFLADPTGKNKRAPRMHVDRSGGVVRGYLAVYGPPNAGGRDVLLAQPPGWKELEAAEAQFLEAEELRLLYVAATRAGCGLTVSMRESKAHYSPWAFFHKPLAKARPRQGASLEVPQSAKGSPISTNAALEAHEAIATRWSTSLEKTYDSVSVKALSVRKGRFTVSQGEHGTEWGTILHTLLEAAMIDPDVDLKALAAAALVELGLSTDLAEEAIGEVHAVMQSDIWRRAANAEKRLVEIPFQRRVDSRDGSPPTILKGTIDLAFKEPDGWVIVDYKSDRISPDNMTELVQTYAPQVSAYADAWQFITRESVHERGLYFTRLREYVVISGMSEGRAK